MHELIWLTYAVIGLIVWVVSYAALPQHSMFGSGSSFVISGCVALLSLIALQPETLSAMLLPYGAFALALVVALVLILVLKIHGHRTQGNREKQDQPRSKTASHGRITRSDR